jgi:hypothetical protein
MVLSENVRRTTTSWRVAYFDADLVAELAPRPCRRVAFGTAKKTRRRKILNGAWRPCNWVARTRA